MPECEVGHLCNHFMTRARQPCGRSAPINRSPTPAHRREDACCKLNRTRAAIRLSGVFRAFKNARRPGPIFDRARSRDALRCRILLFGPLRAAQPAFAHAVPGSTFFAVRRPFGNSKTFVCVSAKFCRWVHGALAWFSCRNGTRLSSVPVARHGTGILLSHRITPQLFLVSIRNQGRPACRSFCARTYSRVLRAATRPRPHSPRLARLVHA
jgi:hypothetical protein